MQGTLRWNLSNPSILWYNYFLRIQMQNFEVEGGFDKNHLLISITKILKIRKTKSIKEADIINEVWTSDIGNGNEKNQKVNLAMFGKFINEFISVRRKWSCRIYTHRYELREVLRLALNYKTLDTTVLWCRVTSVSWHRYKYIQFERAPIVTAKSFGTIRIN